MHRQEMDLFLFFTILTIASAHVSTASPPPATFVFGDSLVDTGNNNYIDSLAKANFRPNGIDFPGQQPTGRFCNGRIISDFLSEHWGVEPILPVLDPNAKGQNLLRGLNFASAGGGILDETGSNFVGRLRFSQQLQFFRQYKQDLAQVINEKEAEALVSGALYSVIIGGNDYINNYLPSQARGSEKYTPLQFQDLLISTLKGELKELYELGARKINMANLGPIGCIPSQLAKNKVPLGEGCIERLQQMVISFNTALKDMSNQLRQELPDLMILYGNTFDITMDYINNAASYGFENHNTGCCGQGPYNGIFNCNPFSNVCSDRSIYIFWDPFHPTERMNKLVTQRLLFGPPTDISPINLSQLFG